MRVLRLMLFGTLAFWSLAARAQTAQTVYPVSDLDTDGLSDEPHLRWGADPFMKVPGYHPGAGTVDEADPSKYQLGGIVFDKDHPLAVVNGKVVSVNAYVGARQVVEIGRNYVVLERGDSRIELQLPPAKESHAEIKPVDEEGKKR